MKKIVIYLLLVFAVIINVYLIFYWEPQNKVINQQEINNENLSYSKLGYKLETGELMERLSSDDRKEFEKIMKKLSTFDIGKIKEYYEDSNEEESLKNIFTLLQKRLTTEDYQSVKKISYSFLDFERVNPRTKNN